MKNKLIAYALLLLPLAGMFSCDKVEKPYPEVSDFDTTIYPGPWSEYETTIWPTFANNTNTFRNVLIEDFTGHECVFCPAAAALAEDIKHDNPGRVFIAGIHSGPTGLGSFQELKPPLYVHDFTNPQGLEIGKFLGSIPGSTFQGNPCGAINRFPENGQNTIVPNVSAWTNRVNSLITANDLKVNIQAKLNYYDETRGFYLHTEVELLEPIANGLAQVVYFIEDSIVKPQAFPNGVDSLNYVHHNVHRSCIDGRALGKTLTDADKGTNGKYYLNYSYRIPSQYDPENVHLLVYVLDKVTNEIYQVIEVDVK